MSDPADFGSSINTDIYSGVGSGGGLGSGYDFGLGGDTAGNTSYIDDLIGSFGSDPAWGDLGTGFTSWDDLPTDTSFGGSIDNDIYKDVGLIDAPFKDPSEFSARKPQSDSPTDAESGSTTLYPKVNTFGQGDASNKSDSSTPSLGSGLWKSMFDENGKLTVGGANALGGVFNFFSGAAGALIRSNQERRAARVADRRYKDARADAAEERAYQRAENARLWEYKMANTVTPQQRHAWDLELIRAKGEGGGGGGSFGGGQQGPKGGASSAYAGLLTQGGKA